jgi:small subunit ribosomal protein S6
MSMGRYEIIYILAPNTPEDTMNELVERFESEITSGGGVLLRVEKWGRKKLAYEVRKFREGFFVLFVTDCEGALVDELERRFRMTDPVIKFMTVRVDEELKRAGKMPKDEELGKPVETERIDRSRRSGPKPPVRTEAPAGTPRPRTEASGDSKAADGETTETVAETPAVDAEPEVEKPAVEESTVEEPQVEAPVEETAEPATEEDGATEDSDSAEDK